MNVAPHPQSSPEFVIGCRTGIMRVYARQGWVQHLREAAPLFTLSEDEAVQATSETVLLPRSCSHVRSSAVGP